MKKFLVTLCAAMLCVCCLALAACGGGASGSASGSASASASSAANPADKFAGEWKIAAAESQGLTLTGDFSAILGDTGSFSMTVNADGTGKMNMGSESADFTWKLANDNAIDITANEQTVQAVYNNDALEMTMSDDTFSGTMIFTHDGKYAGAPAIDTAAAKAVTSEDALVGTWTLSSLSMMGVSMYGDAESLAAMAGDTDVTMVFEKGGKCTALGTEATFTVGADGAAIDLGGMSLPIKSLDNSIVLDMTEALGTEMIMVFSK